MLNSQTKPQIKLRGFSRRKQIGATLLAYILVLISGTSYLLVRNYNANIQKIESATEAGIKLKLAKQALIGYATTYPDNVNATEGPGYLLCPDTDNDGMAEANCSLGGGTTIGRFPWKTLELLDIYDTSGQTIWYALSENYRYGANKQIPLNSETEGQLSVDGINDIVAVLFSPGEPVTGQNRTSGSNLISHYLEDDNADADTAFVTTLAAPNVKRLDGIYDANDSLVFNDKLVYITRQELMDAVEKRVLGEVSQILGNYFTTYGAYPWLAPFADPKAINRSIQGTAESGSSSTLLIDSGQDFLELGVVTGDVVYNITDSSIGIVSANPTLSDRITVGSLRLGDENDFDLDDEYYVVTKNRTSVLTATTTSGSSGTVLRDSVNNLTEINIGIGDIVDNLSDGSSGIITSISSSQVDAASLSGGTNNVFAVGDTYQIRTNTGIATSSSTTQLQDTSKDFVAMGVQTNDLIWNMTDDSFARVSTVAANTLGFDEILYGTENDIDINDDYQLTRFDSATGTREGMLPIHEVGMPFATGFHLDWRITPDAGDIVSDTSLLTTYMNQFLNSEMESFDGSVGICIWSVVDMADCYGYKWDFLSIAGRMTSGNNTDRIIDSVASFVTENAKTGDIAQNYDDESSVYSGNADAGTSGTTLIDAGNDFSSLIPYSYLIHNTSQGTRGLIADVIDADTVIVAPYVGSVSTAITFSPGDNYTIYEPRSAVVDYIVGQTELDTDQYTSYNPDFDTNEYYRIIPAAKSYSGTATDDDDDILEDTSVVTAGRPNGFLDLGIEVGDIVYNDHASGDWGEITAVTATTVETNLYGDHEHFRDGDDYTIYYDYVYSREHIYHARIRGEQNTKTVSETRVRDVCMGYPADCPEIAGTATNGGASFTVLQDTTKNFSGSGVSIGDTVTNYTDGSKGLVSSVSTTQLTVGSLSGGTLNRFDTGDEYSITSPTSTSFSLNGGIAFLTVKDYQEDRVTQVGEATFTPTTASSGSVRVNDIKFNLAEVNNDLPGWFIKNDWHKLVYVAYSGNDAPGGTSVCTAGTNCITLDGASLPGNNNRALLLAAGNETTTLRDQNCNVLGSAVQQDRTSGLINAYFELENCDSADDTYTLSGLADDFNDQVRVLGTSP